MSELVNGVFQRAAVGSSGGCRAGVGTKAIALKSACSQSWVRRVKQEYREQGKTGAKTTRNRVPDWQPLAEDIVRLTDEFPDQTLAKLKERLGSHLSKATSAMIARGCG